MTDRIDEVRFFWGMFHWSDELLELYSVYIYNPGGFRFFAGKKKKKKKPLNKLLCQTEKEKPSDKN